MKSSFVYNLRMLCSRSILVSSSICSFTILMTILCFTNNALSWGPVSHMAIGYGAYKDLENTTMQSNFELSQYLSTSQFADVMSTAHVYGAIPLNKGEKLSFLHNLAGCNYVELVPEKEADNTHGFPLFGVQLLKASIGLAPTVTTNLEEQARCGITSNDALVCKSTAYGWIAHQLADGPAHGSFGIANNFDPCTYFAGNK